MKVVLADSGGTDSSYLKWLLKSRGDEVTAVTFTVPDLTLPEIATNLPTRCYHCKRAMFARLTALAAEIGAEAVMDGTNADDLGEDRPGLKAAREFGVRSPLAELGLTKAEIRRRARAAGIAVADRPSSPCLATRFPFGETLTPAKLQRAAAAEAAMHRQLGENTNLRVRFESEYTVRLEVEPAALTQAAANYAALAAALVTPLGLRLRSEIRPLHCG